MNSLLQAVPYVWYSTLFVVFLLGVGAAGLSPWLGRLPPLDRLSLSLSSGLALGVLGSTLWAYGEWAAWPFAAAAVAGSVYGLVALVHSSWREHPNPQSLGRRLGAVAVVAAGSAALALTQYRRVFTSGFLPDGLTAFSNDNNDVAIYLMQADNVRATGFGNLDRIAYNQAGDWAKGDHTGASTLYSLLSTVARLTVTEAAIPVIAAVVAVTALLLARLAMMLGLKSVVLVGVCAAWAISAPFSAVIQTNYFLGQIVSRALLVALVVAAGVLVLAERREGLAVVTLAPVALLTAAGLVTYPAGHIPALGGASLIVCGLAVSHVRSTSWREQSVRVLLVGAAMIVGAVLVLPRWRIITDTIRLYSTENITGWPRQTLDVRVLLGLPGGLSRPISVWAALACAGLIALLVTGVIAIVRQHSWQAVVGPLSLVLAAALLYGVVVARSSSTAYQAWKMAGTVQPLVIVGWCVLLASGLRWAASMLGAELRSLLRPVVLLPAVILIAWTTIASQGGWTDVTRSQDLFDARHVRTEIVELGGSDLVRAQPELRIRLSDYFETMVTPAAANLYGTHLDSISYFGLPRPGGTCTLTDVRFLDSLAEVSTGPALPVGKNLVLVPTPFCVSLDP